MRERKSTMMYRITFRQSPMSVCIVYMCTHKLYDRCLLAISSHTRPQWGSPN